MQAVRRFAGGDPGTILDAAMGIAGAGLTAVAIWDPAGLAGTRITGPPWLLALLPLLVGAPLALRRRAPVLMLLAISAGIALQCLITKHPPHILELLVLFAGGYSLGAHASLRRAAAGLGISAVVILSAPPARRLSVIPILAFWLAGVLVRARRQAASLARRNEALQQQAEQAAAAERTRIARELHDIIAHHLSVVVLQAAGARASGKAADAALEKIEHSGRQALAETRRLLGVLRDTGEEAGLTPQPGIGELDALAASVRAAGLPVNLVISGDHTALPAAVDVSVYRIVQEALTNVLKHAGPARADVTIGCTDGAVTIEITDDGAGEPGERDPAGGHGLAGMRERVAIFGGELRAGPRPGGGFAVRARLPLGDGASPSALPRDDRLLLGDALQPGAVISVLIVDDQDLVREGLRMLLEAEPQLSVAGEAGDGGEALTRARQLDPDVILMDVRMPQMNGIEATTRLVQAGCRARIVMLTTFNLDEYVYQALKAGASGFLLKDASREQLTGAVRAVAAGETLLAPAITRRLIEDFCSGPAPGAPAADAAGRLSERELGVVRLVAQGLSNAEIAARLYLSEATVKSHIARILAKLDLRDRVQVAVYAYEHGIVRPGHKAPPPG